MDGCIRNGVTSSETHLPGGMNVKRRAPGLYKRLQKGFYHALDGGDEGAGRRLLGEEGGMDVVKKAKNRLGRVDHPVRIVPRRTTPVFPGIEYLSCMAIAVSCVGGRVRAALIVGERGERVGWTGRDCAVSPRQ
jgi:hypothetical protein